jgi:GT2 family glycosyltransferase
VADEPPLVSVIIPNYNYARTLGHSIRSAHAQAYPRLEIIVVDDRSTDDSPRVAEEAARETGATVLRTAVNSGVSTARNLGAEHARGDILFFLDSDVALEPDAVGNAVRLLLAEPGLGAICGMYLPEPMFADSLVKEYRALQQYFWFNEIEGPIPGLHSALFGIRTEVFREVGPFNPRLRHTEEQEYGFRLHQRYEVRATKAIRGRHDHDADLRTVLRKVFHRTRLGIPHWIHLHRLPGGAATGGRALSAAVFLLAVADIALPFLLGPAAIAVPVLLVALAILLDLRVYRYVFRRKGVGFGLYFVCVHTLVNLTCAVAAGIGVLHGVLFPRRVRRLYATEDLVGPPAEPSAGLSAAGGTRPEAGVAREARA